MILAPAANAESVRVSAAASLADALTEAAALFEKRSAHRVKFNFAASSTLARQISEGAPADVFISADDAKMRALEREGMLEHGTRRAILSNVLVIAVPARSDALPRDARALTMPRFRRIAIAEPSTVPAGIYARRLLERERLWRAIEKKLVRTDNVRAALAAVESGDADAAFVYRTDARASREARIAFAFEGSSEMIRYSAAVLRQARAKGAARQFLAFLETAEARAVFERHGFIALK